MHVSSYITARVAAGAFVCGLLAGCEESRTPLEVGGLAASKASAAGAPTEVDPTPFEIPAGVFCDFAFRVEPAGKAKAIALPGERMIFLSPGLTWTLTNLDTQKQVTFRVPGAFHVDTLENGDLVTVVTGRNILGDPIAGLVLAMGRFSFVFDASGTLIQPLQGTGRLVDVCEVLS
jgi:hypothetical protein